MIFREVALLIEIVVEHLISSETTTMTNETNFVFQYLLPVKLW